MGLSNNNGKILKTEGGRELIMSEIVSNRLGYNTSDKIAKIMIKK